jgi:hypothetical protein
MRLQWHKGNLGPLCPYTATQGMFSPPMIQMWRRTGQIGISVVRGAASGTSTKGVDKPSIAQHRPGAFRSAVRTAFRCGNHGFNPDGYATKPRPGRDGFTTMSQRTRVADTRSLHGSQHKAARRAAHRTVDVDRRPACRISNTSLSGRNVARQIERGQVFVRPLRAAQHRAVRQTRHPVRLVR